MTDTPDEKRQLSPALIATLVAIPVMVIAGFITFAALKNRAAPDTPVDSYAVTGQDAKACDDFIAALPDSFGDYAGKEVTGDLVRWPSVDPERGGDPITLRCGVVRPDDLAPTSALQVIDPVQWFITDSIEGRGQAYVVVDRRPYVGVWVPAGAGNAPLTDISKVIAQKLPAAPLDFGN